MTIHYFISGKWQGYFTDGREFAGHPANSKWDMEIIMEFKNNHEFTATGTDQVGSFIFKDGKITDGKVEFIKTYGSHNVCYEGEAKGPQMTGHWWLENAPNCTGDWAIWPATA